MSEFGATSEAMSSQLCGYVSRIERLEESIAEFNDDKKEIYGEAKSVGFDVKTLKKVIQRRRKARSDVQEEDEMLELYEGIIRSYLGKAQKVDCFGDPLA